jgi:3-dehydroquinate synthase
VGPLHAATVNADAPLIAMSAGEEHKNLDTVRGLYEQLLRAGLDRSGVVLALGGGVVGDVAGYVAASYLRGVSLIQAPTSLLAMVDASVGGKTGVDLPQGKNLVGAFKQPEMVIVDLALLSTLPAVEFAAGMAEVVKSGLIAAPALFGQLEQESWSERDIRSDAGMRQLQELVTGAIRVKRDVVQDDPYEKGRRALLNLGHTFAHAIEQVSRYQVRHGEAVAMGLSATANLSACLGFCAPELQSRIDRVLARCNLPVSIPADLAPEALLAAMQTDKKRAEGRIHFVLMRDIGDVFLQGDVPREAVLATLHELCSRDWHLNPNKV